MSIFKRPIIFGLIGTLLTWNVPVWAAESSSVPVTVQTNSQNKKAAPTYPGLVTPAQSSGPASGVSVFLTPGKKIELLNGMSGSLKDIDAETLKKEAQSEWLQAVKVESNRFTLNEGRSHFMRFSNRIARISVSNPAVLDFLTLTSSEILLNAKTHGSVNLMVWDLKGEMSSFDINVIRDPGLLDQLLHEIDPKGEFEIFPSRDVFVVRGYTSSVSKQKYVEDAVKSFAPGSVSLVRIKQIKQILLQIRFVQVDHSRNYDFGIDMQRFAEGNKHVSGQTFAPGGTHAVPNSNVTTTMAPKIGSFTRAVPALLAENDATTRVQDVYQLVYESDNNLYLAYLKAKETEGIAKTIARPNLLAKDGEEASFVVGGESAVAFSDGNSVSVQYKEFGTSLKYKPEIMEDGEISLTIEPEVSQLNSANGVEINNFTIPGFSKTKVKTVVQLKDGQTLIIGGMIQQTMSTSDNGVPFLRRLPVIGKAFQSTDRNWQETELLIIVTPRIVKPENEPLNSGKENDVLGKATELVEPAIPVDIQASSIKYYIEKNQRWADLDKIEAELEAMQTKKKSEPAKKD